MTVVVAPPYLTQEARHDWDLLQRQTLQAHPFDPGQAELLPDPARRWVLHTIAPGTAMLRAVVLSTHGTIKLGSWRRFRATQVLSPLEDFVWSASACLGLLPVRGLDRYRAGAGEMRWRLLDAFSLMSGTGADITRSAAGRLACEFVLTPAVALDPRVRRTRPSSTGSLCLHGYGVAGGRERRGGPTASSSASPLTVRCSDERPRRDQYGSAERGWSLAPTGQGPWSLSEPGAGGRWPP